jgi:hypothetical protein
MLINRRCAILVSSAPHRAGESLGVRPIIVALARLVWESESQIRGSSDSRRVSFADT